MTLEEAKKVATIVGTADGGCSHCVGYLREKLAKTFPQFKWQMNENSQSLDGEDAVLVEARAVCPGWGRGNTYVCNEGKIRYQCAESTCPTCKGTGFMDP